MTSRLWGQFATIVFPVALLVLGSLSAWQYARESARAVDAAASHLSLLTRSTAPALDEALTSGDQDQLQRICTRIADGSPLRLTVIREDGRVLADTAESPEVMDNHRDRAEIQQALDAGTGISQRFSQTLGLELLYEAHRVEDQNGGSWVVRSALPVAAIQGPMYPLPARIFTAIAVALLFSLGTQWLVNRLYVQPMEAVRTSMESVPGADARLKRAAFHGGEAVRLADALNRMQARLHERIDRADSNSRELEAVLASMMEAVVAVDMRGNILKLNTAAATLFHVSRENAEGRALQEVIRYSALHRFIDRIRAKSAPIQDDLVVYEDGERFFRANGTVLRNGQNRAIGTVVALNEVTGLRRLELARTEFVANVSHELRTPITSIKGYIETLQDGAIEEPEAARKFLGVIARQAARLDQLIADLLMLSRIERTSERRDLRMERGNLAGVVDAAVQTCQPVADERGIQIRTEVPEDLQVAFNPPLIQQALVNLVDNALKYSEAGTEVVIRATHEADEIQLSVEDQGCGISKEHLPRVFERFYRVDAARSRNKGGTGLGLAIIKHIMRVHEGQVTVESAPGKGSTFTLHWPADAGNSRDTANSSGAPVA